MALKTINDLTTDASPASTDYVATWDGSASTSKKVTLAAAVSGAANAAMLAVANTFTKAQVITPDSNAVALTLNAYTGASGYRAINVANIDWASTQPGPHIRIGKNDNADDPAAGSLRMAPKTAAERHIWVDDSGNMRIGTSPPTEATDTSAGSVVGTQTSHEDYKDISGPPVADAEALAMLVAAAANVARFTYKSGAFNGEEFSGLILSGPEKLRYGMDADEEHPAGRALNEVTLLGDLLLAVRELNRRLEALEGA